MKSLVLSVLVLGTVSFTANAEPTPLANGQMDRVSAGQLVDVTVANNSIPVTVAVPVSAAVQALTSNSNASARSPLALGVASSATNPGIIR